MTCEQAGRFIVNLSLDKRRWLIYQARFFCNKKVCYEFHNYLSLNRFWSIVEVRIVIEILIAQSFVIAKVLKIVSIRGAKSRT